MQKTDFASIYAAWEQTHDEKEKISKRVSSDSKIEKPKALTVNELKKMNVQSELDLHNVTLDEASSQARAFLESSYHRNLRKVRIITGKGLHSPNGVSVIRPQILHIVRNSKFVSSFDENPKACDGGSGAIIIILKQKVF